MSVVGERVRKWRDARELTQEQLAKLVRVSQQTIDKIERGITRNPRYIVEIAAALDVSASYLKGLTDDPTPEPMRKRVDSALNGLPDERLADVLAYLEELKRRA